MTRSLLLLCCSKLDLLIPGLPINIREGRKSLPLTSVPVYITRKVSDEEKSFITSTLGGRDIVQFGQRRWERAFP